MWNSPTSIKKDGNDTLTGKTMRLESLTSESLFENLKFEIQKREGISESQESLIFNQKVNARLNNSFIL